jgi:lipoate-protein ligase A
VLQHGTILLRVDVDKMFALLRVPNEKLKGKLIEDVKQRVTSIERETGKEIGFDETAEAMRCGFEKNFNAELVEGELAEDEVSLAKKIEKEKFLSGEWNYLR